jgi:hypothetical protein
MSSRFRRCLGVAAVLATAAAGCGSCATPAKGGPGHRAPPATPRGAPTAPATGTPAPPATARPPRCRDSQLTVAITNSGAATGHVGATISFTSHATAPCTLRGWPHLVAVTAAGHTVTVSPVLQTFFGPPHLTSPPAVTIPPGGQASAVLEGGDLPLHGTACPPSYRRLRVTPPGGTRASGIRAWLPGFGHYLPACAPLRVSPVVRPSELP